MSEENKPGEEEKNKERSSLLSDEFELYFSFTKPLVLDLPSSKDRAIAAAWVQKLESEPESNEEKKQRLNYVKLLLFVLQRGRLSGIFRNQPPSGPLQSFPQGFSILDMGNWMLDQTDAQICGAGDTGCVPYTIDVSNDLREFVASQEVPNFGIQMYYAWSCDEPIHKWTSFDEDKFPMYILDKIKQLKEIRSDEKFLTSKNFFGMKKKNGVAYQQDKSSKKKVKSPQEIEKSQGRSFHTYMGLIGRMGNFNKKCNEDPEKFQRQEHCIKKCIQKCSQTKFPGNGGEAGYRSRDECADFVSNTGGFNAQTRCNPYSYSPQYQQQAGGLQYCEELQFSPIRNSDNPSRQDADWEETEMIRRTQRRPKRDTYVASIPTTTTQRRLFPPRSRSVSPKCPQVACGRDGYRGGAPTSGICTCSSPPCTCPCPRAPQTGGETEQPQAISKPRRQDQKPCDTFGRNLATSDNFKMQNVCSRQGPSTRMSPSPRQNTPCPRQDTPCPRQDSPYPRQDSPYPRQDSPYPRQDSPYPQQDIPYPRPDSPYPRPDSPYPRPDSPYPRQDSPYPRQDSPYPQQDIPYPRPDSPYPRQDSPYSPQYPVCPRPDTPCPRPPSSSRRSPSRRQDQSPDRTLVAQDSVTIGQPEIVHCYDDQNPDPTLMPCATTYTKEPARPGTPVPLSGNKYMDESLISSAVGLPRYSTPRKRQSGPEAECSQLLDFDLSPIESQFAGASEDDAIYLYASSQKASNATPLKNLPHSQTPPAQFLSFNEEKTLCADPTLSDTLTKSGVKPKSAPPCCAGRPVQGTGGNGRITNMANVLQVLKQKNGAHREKCEVAESRKSPSPQPPAARPNRSPLTPEICLNEEEIPSSFTTDSTPSKKMQSRQSSRQSPKEQEEVWQLPFTEGGTPSNFSDTLTPLQHPQETCPEDNYRVEQQTYEELEDDEPQPGLICTSPSEGRPPEQGSRPQGGMPSTSTKPLYKKKYKDSAHYVMEGSYLNNLESCNPQLANIQWQSPPEYMKSTRRINFSELDTPEGFSLPSTPSPSMNVSESPLENYYMERSFQQNGRPQRGGGTPKIMTSPQACVRPQTSVQQEDYRRTELSERGRQTRTWQPMKISAVIDEIPEIGPSNTQAQWQPMRVSQRSRGVLNLLEPQPFSQETSRGKISPLRLCPEPRDEMMERSNQQYARQSRNNRTQEHLPSSYASSIRTPQGAFNQTQRNQCWVTPKAIFIDNADPTMWTSPIVMRNAMVREEVDNGDDGEPPSDGAECDIEEPVFVQETNRVSTTLYQQNFAEDNQVCDAEDYPLVQGVENPDTCPNIQNVTQPQNVTPVNNVPPPFRRALPMSRPQIIFSPVTNPPSM